MGAGIHGYGLVSSLGGNVEETWQAMLAGKDALRAIDRFAVDDFPQISGGLLPTHIEEDLRANEDEDDLAMAMILRAAKEALNGPPPAGTGLVLASNFGLMETREWCWRERIDTDDMDAATFARQQQVVQHVAESLGCEGPTAQLSLSCASGAAAVALAWQWVMAGRCEYALAICYDAITEFCWCGLSNLRTITTDQIRPFNKERHGTIFSEGAGALLLGPEEGTSLSVLGAATNNNAYHITAPAKGADGSRRVMAEALRNGGVEPAAVDFVSSHGTGTAANDVTESTAINNLFGRRLPVAAFKSNLGHMMGAAGAAEIIISLKALEAGAIPPVINMQQQDPECDVDVVLGKPRRGEFAVAITDSAGLGGNNASAVLGWNASFVPETTDREVVFAGCGWVLPGDCGSGEALPEVSADELLGRNDELASFSVKPYISTVKGYLDPAGAFSLAAASLCLGEKEIPDPSRTAVISATQYGAATSGYRFFELMVQKGHRFASPMVFPHSYANTAGNLVAIERSLSGPHLVFDSAPHANEAIWAATDLIRRGDADDALVIVNESAPAKALPDDVSPLHGAVCIHLTSRCGEKVGEIPQAQATLEDAKGVVYSILK